MIVGSVCLSHSPIMEKKRAAAEVEARFRVALNQAARFVASVAPDLTVVIFPDHMNGFSYGQLPCFCIGLQAESIGDYGSVPGPLDVPQSVALDCAEACIGAGVDLSVSYRMRVDHGAAQPIEFLSAVTPLGPVIPIFVNCIAHPRPSFKRAVEFGHVLGNWARARPERILFVGSGGLSHDPPLPNLEGASPEVRARLIADLPMTYAERVARQARVLRVGYDMADNQLRPLNPQWDRAALQAFARCDLTFLAECSDAEVTEIAGSGAHELRTWMTALAALRSSSEFDADVLFYEPVSEWITGMGVMTAMPHRTQVSPTITV